MRRARKRLICFGHRARKIKAKVWVPITPRYFGLMWISILCCIMAIAYSPLSNLPVTRPPGLSVATGLLPEAAGWWHPAWLLGAAWTTVGVSGLVTIARHRPGELVFQAQLAMLVYWALSFLMAFFILGDPRSWVTGGIFLIFSGITWSLTRVDPPFRTLWRRFKWTRS
jgi:hypothetical protein